MYRVDVVFGVGRPASPLLLLAHLLPLLALLVRLLLLLPLMLLGTAVTGLLLLLLIIVSIVSFSILNWNILTFELVERLEWAGLADLVVSLTFSVNGFFHNLVEKAGVIVLLRKADRVGITVDISLYNQLGSSRVHDKSLDLGPLDILLGDGQWLNSVDLKGDGDS